jgi:ribosomal peptide maturation radical SAM protein 1
MTPKVLLIQPPLASAKAPALGLTVLKGNLASRGIGCQIRYLNLDFAKMAGFQLYNLLSRNKEAPTAQWAFAKELFGEQIVDEETYYARAAKVGGRGLAERLKTMRQMVPAFVEDVMRSVDWGCYDIVGFAAGLGSTPASLLLADRVRRNFPGKIIVMGGADCRDEMGVELHRACPFVDYVFTGEADETLPEFVLRLGRGEPIRDIPGIVYRNGSGSEITGPAGCVASLDNAPLPDYDDYFEQLKGLTRVKLAVKMPVETARGCWWGAKQRCRFCGTPSRQYQTKSPERVLAELEHLRQRYGSAYFLVHDSIFNNRFLDNLIPAIKQKQWRIAIQWEVKVGLKKEHVRLLAEAGVRVVQPGIEAFSTHLLRAMNKGCTALQNVQLMKWGRQYGILVTFNLICGLPGGEAHDYAEQLAVIRGLHHLDPPNLVPFVLMRFSSYYENAQDFGLVRVHPSREYQYQFPPAYHGLAYFFDFRCARRGMGGAQRYWDPLQTEIKAWKVARWAGATCYFTYASDGQVRIDDCRKPDLHKKFMLSGWMADVYAYCDSIHSLAAIRRHLEHRSHPAPSAEELQRFLDSMVGERLMLREGDSYLSLAVEGDEPRAGTLLPKP